ncbi:MAG TPA: DUF3037 domain-containing protein [Candidatus Koribacter sp.]|jgi:hypothetical protein
MANLKQLEFLVLRYVPDAVKGEFVNFGVVVLEGGADGVGFADVRVTRDWRRVKCLDPDVETEMLEAVEGEIRARLQSGAVDCSKGGVAMAQREWIMKMLEDSFSNALQVTDAKAVLAEDPRAELGKLVEMYCESQARARRQLAGRHVIYGRMKDEFERAGVWPLMRKRIPVAEYTGKGDPLRIDCGYRPNGVVKMFQAVSLESDLDAAKVLAFTFPQLREGIARVEGAKAELTAVVEDDLDRNDDAVDFALITLARNEIAVAQMSALPEIAARARVELRV